MRIRVKGPKTLHRTLTRRNVIRVAMSLFKIFPNFQYSHIYGILTNALERNCKVYELDFKESDHTIMGRFVE